MSLQNLLTLFFFPFLFCFYLVSPIFFIAGIVPIMLSLYPSPPASPSLPVVKQQGRCDSKLRKLPIKGNMYLNKESQEERIVCIIAKERVIWRHLSWTGQFPVSGASQKYPLPPQKKDPGKGKRINLLFFLM